jgi:ribose transport system substrate-binding protein
MNSLRVILAGGCLLLGLMDMACSTTQQTSTKKLAFVTNNAADFWTIARKGCEQADSELDNVDVEFRIPSDGTAADQRRIVDDLLAKACRVGHEPSDPSTRPR